MSFIPQELADRFGLSSDSNLLSHWHALTFEVRRMGVPAILRLTPAGHRSPQEVAAELEWMEFVGKRGVRVPEVIRCNRGAVLEEAELKEGNFTAVLFEKLAGLAIKNEDLGADLFMKWGRFVGRLHRLGTEFQPHLEARRKSWFESDFLNIEKYIPDDLAVVKERARAVISKIKSLPFNRENYGPMHADVYQDNFFLGQEDLELFDFDNSEYGFFINDIAIGIYAVLWRVPDESGWDGYANEFLRFFKKGYSQEFELPGDQWQHLPLFLRLRDVLIYTVTRKKRDLLQLTERQKSVFQARENRIIAGRPVVTLSTGLSDS